VVCSPSSLPIPAMPYYGGLSLTVLHLCSLPIQPDYDRFRSELENRLGSASTDNNIFEEPVDIAMEVLQAEWEREKALAADRDGVDDGNEAMEADVEVQPQIPAYGVDDALKILIKNATEQFGFAPRDVYGGIFSPVEVKAKHHKALRGLNYPQLMSLCKAFHMSHEFDKYSHRVIAVSPVESALGYDEWRLNFKSTQIAKEAVLSMRLLEKEHLRDMYVLIHDIPENSGLLGQVFEAIAHRMLPGKDVPQPTLMATDDKIPPTFSTTATQAPPTPPRDRALTFTTVNLRRDLSDFDGSGYCVPASPTNPLFDSFTVDLDPDNCTGVISVYQITISERHEGSADGYLFIRKIMARARKLLNCPKGSKPNIEVKYFLVCPEDGVDHKWKMPDGWKEKTNRYDHAGEAFCIRVPSSYFKVCCADSPQILRPT